MTDQAEGRSSVQLEDPRAAGPEPPYPAQEQEPPGVESRMTPRPDHGEETYVGAGRLLDRVALITGADSGIGKAVALAYAREGADVVVSYLNETEDARDTIRLIEAEGRRAIDAPGDIGQEAHCRELVERTVRDFGRIDILVNNAAFQMSYQSIEEIPSEEFERTYRTNLFSAFYLCKAAIPKMEPGSSIINTASVEAANPIPILLPYASTKGALVTFSKALAQLVAQRGIRVNVVAPGPVWTPLIPYSMPQEAVQSFGDSTAMGRTAQPKELAPIFVLLASPEASYMTGGVHPVHGGMPG